MKTVIGIDYGTLSARGVLVNTENGEVLLKDRDNGKPLRQAQRGHRDKLHHPA